MQVCAIVIEMVRLLYFLPVVRIYDVNVDRWSHQTGREAHSGQIVDARGIYIYKIQAHPPRRRW